MAGMLLLLMAVFWLPILIYKTIKTLWEHQKHL
jgi:hypothetical protein